MSNLLRQRLKLFIIVIAIVIIRFTNFDFTKPRRVSYYPHNQPILAAKPRGERDLHSPSSSSSGARSNSNDSVTNTMVAGFATFAERSMPGTIPLEEYDYRTMRMPREPEAAMMPTRPTY